MISWFYKILLSNALYYLPRPKWKGPRLLIQLLFRQNSIWAISVTSIHENETLSNEKPLGLLRGTLSAPPPIYLWWGRRPAWTHQDSNLKPPSYQPGALELTLPRLIDRCYLGITNLSCETSANPSQLSYVSVSVWILVNITKMSIHLGVTSIIFESSTRFLAD